LLALFLEHKFSADVFTLLIKPEFKDHIHTQPCNDPVLWLFLSPEDQQNNLQHLSHAHLTNCLHTIELKPECSCAACSLAIFSLFFACCLDLEGYYSSEIAADI
jgi:hypothetical protein